MTTIVTRAGKGSPLTNTEMDTNLTNLNSYKVEQDISGNATITGDVYLTGSGKRIIGDFSNATIANRLIFETSTLNGSTTLSAKPNSSGANSYLELYSTADPANCTVAALDCINASEVRIRATKNGSFGYIPMTFYTGGSERMRIDTSGNVNVTSPAGLGYGTGAGGTVTQATSKSTTVTLNKPTGQITMNNEALAAGAEVGFALNNSLMQITDNFLITVNGNTPNYWLYRVRVISNNGAALIFVKNEGGSSVSDAVVLNFAIIKGASA